MNNYITNLVENYEFFYKPIYNFGLSKLKT